MEVIIVLIAIWLYPVLAWLYLYLTRKTPWKRKKVILCIAVVAVISVIGAVTGISTTLSLLDWLLLTSSYLLLMLGLFLMAFHKGVFKIPGIILTSLVLFINYTLGSAGFVGVALAIDARSCNKEVWLDDGLIYKEFREGNVLTDYRRLKVELYHTFPWFPLIEWKVQEDIFNSYIAYGNKLLIDYNKDKREIHLSTSMRFPQRDTTYYWADTVFIR